MMPGKSQEGRKHRRAWEGLRVGVRQGELREKLAGLLGKPAGLLGKPAGQARQVVREERRASAEVVMSIWRSATKN